MCNAMYMENEKLAYYVIRREFPSYENNEDLIQEAKLALWKACLHFNPERGHQFSTYAYHVIKNTLRSVLRRESQTFEQRMGNGIVSLDAEIGGEDDGAKTTIGSLTSAEGVSDCSILETNEIMLKVLNEDELQLCKELASGMSQQEIAKREGLTRQGLNNRLLKIRKKLEACGMLAR